MSSEKRQIYNDVIHIDAARAIKDIDYARSASKGPSFIVYHDAFVKLIGESPQIKLIETRSYQFAHEAGVYIPKTNSVYFTSNYQTSNPVEIHGVDCSSLAITKVTWPDVHYGNGACQYQSKVLYCSQGTRSVPSSLILVDPVTSTSETLVNNFYGREFSSINDVVVHHKTGDIWFTDPTYGYEQAFRPSPTLPVQCNRSLSMFFTLASFQFAPLRAPKQVSSLSRRFSSLSCYEIYANFSGVYRFSPTTSQICMVADGFIQCNGLCFSPDYSLMYVTDTGAIQAHAGPGDGHQFSCNPRLPSTIYVYDVIDGRRLHNRRVFAYCHNGVPDGIKCDGYGNVYSGCGDGVHVWDPEGLLIGKINVGVTTANFCFAKGGIWMFSEMKLFFCQFGAKGALVDVECT